MKSLFLLSGEEKNIYSKTKINHKTGEGGRNDSRYYAECREKMNCTSWVRHSGTRGYFPGARLLISKSTGLDDPCWSNGVHEDACINNASTVGVLAGGPRVTLCAPGCLALSSLWVTCRGQTATAGSPGFSRNANVIKTMVRRRHREHSREHTSTPFS